MYSAKLTYPCRVAIAPNASEKTILSYITHVTSLYKCESENWFYLNG